VGIDIDDTAIRTAKEFCKVSTPPRPYLRFVKRDITQPFHGEQEGLNEPGKSGYDFIYAIVVIEYLAEARHHIQRIYQYALKLGGIIYLRANVLQPQAVDIADGWVAAHPAVLPFYQQFFAFIQNKNPGVEVAKALAEWLREMGASKVVTQRTQVIAGGSTPVGIAMLRNSVMALRSSAPFLISRGLVSQAQYDDAMRRLFEELDTYSEGYNVLIDTLAAKP
jgi:hypothetical protein